MSFRPTLLIACLALAACEGPSGPMQTLDDAFVYSTDVPAGMPVYVRTLVGNIDVTPSPDDSLRVTARMTWRGDAERPKGIALSGVRQPTGVLICAIFVEGECTADKYTGKSKDGFRLGGAQDVHVHFTVQVPHGVRLDLVVVDGDISSASSAPVRARSVNGDVTVVTAVGPVVAETINGDVDARMTTLSGPDSVIAKTMNGDAWAFIPDSVAASVDVSTVNGSLITDFPDFAGGDNRRKTLKGGLRGGGTPVRVRTLNGTVGLGRLDAEGRTYPR